MPLFFWLFITWFIFASVGNYLHWQRYSRVMSYFETHHPEQYEQLQPKPIWGPFYAKNARTNAVWKFASHHEPLNDPVAEELLADYKRFSMRLMLAFFTLMPLSACFFVIFGVMLYQ